MGFTNEIFFYFLAFIVFYCTILFFDIIFKTCMFHPYLNLLNTSGIVIKPYCMTWYITRFNQVVHSMGHFKPKLLKKWFNIGFYLTFLTMFVALVAFFFPILHYFVELVSQQNIKPGIFPQASISGIPGITTPFFHVIYIIPAYIVSVVFHEFGHALAASRENVPLENCGFAIFFLIPLAFVTLDARKQSCLSSKQQLRIYCAGVWHNMVLFLCSFLFTNYASTILYPHYQTDLGVTVMHVEEKSNLAQFGGFFKGDVVTSINDCNVKNAASWYKCLVEISSSPQLGFCSSEQFLENYEANSYCCMNSSDHLCFHNPYQEVRSFLCLPARKVIDGATFCRKNSDCKESLCLIPYLSSSDWRLISCRRNYNKSVLFIGSMEEVFSSIKISSWISDLKFPSIELLTHLETFFIYLAGVSSGLIILNVTPCYSLDGGYIIEHTIHYIYAIFRMKGSYLSKKSLANKLKTIGFFLLVINIVLGIKRVSNL